MPQDIPIEASETLAYTPPALAGLDPAPSFILRSPTHREKRHIRMLLDEEGGVTYKPDAIRAEMLNGLAALHPEKGEMLTALIKDYWSAQDDFALQAKDDPDLVWSYDADIEQRINALIEEVRAGWRPVRRMVAANSDFSALNMACTIAVMVKSWTNLDLPIERDRGYLSVECALNLCEKLWDICYKAGYGEESRIAWSELGFAASARLYLSEEEAKNLLSPAPSETSPEPSNETNASEKDGKSPAQAPSEPTPDTE